MKNSMEIVHTDVKVQTKGFKREWHDLTQMKAMAHHKYGYR